MKFVIGIDAGFTHTGVSVFKAINGKLKFYKCTTIKTEKSEKKKQVRVADDDAERITKLVLELGEFVSECVTEGNQSYTVIELPSAGAQGARALRAMSIVTGALVAFLTIKNMPSEYVTANDVKIALTGKKTASKDEIMNRVREKMSDVNHLFPKTKDEFEHIADSIGAIMHVRKYSQMYKLFVNQ